MKEFATTSQAVKITGKSESTIKRMVREIAADKSHPDRELISPSPEELSELKAANKPYRWKISVDLLHSRFKSEPDSNRDPKNADDSDDQKVQIVDLLHEQLRSKDSQLAALEKQLDRKDEQIANMNELMKENSERLRESNILMRYLQNHLGIAAPADPDTFVSESSDSVTATNRAQMKAKSRFLSRLFNRKATPSTPPST